MLGLSKYALVYRLSTFVSSLRSGGSTRGNRVLRVAVARVHILIVVYTRLRRPEADREEKENKLND